MNHRNGLIGQLVTTTRSLPMHQRCNTRRHYGPRFFAQHDVGLVLAREVHWDYAVSFDAEWFKLLVPDLGTVWINDAWRSLRKLA